FPQDELIQLPVAPSLYLLSGNDTRTLAALGNKVTRTAWIRQTGNRDVFAVWAQPTSAKAPSPTLAQFGQSLALEDATIEPGARVGDVVPDGSTTLVLRWKVLDPPAYQPSIF